MTAVAVSASKVDYVQTTGYPIMEDFSPHRILVQAIPTTSNPVLHIRCSADMPTEIQIHPINGDKLGPIAVRTTPSGGVDIEQNVTKARFRFYLKVICNSRPVLQFRDYKNGVYLESYCYSDNDDDPLQTVLSWTRAWTQLQHSAPVNSTTTNEDDYKTLLSSRLRRRQLDKGGMYMQMWDVAEVMIAPSIVNYAHVTLGCVGVNQSPGLVVKLPTTILGTPNEGEADQHLNPTGGVVNTNYTLLPTTGKVDCEPQRIPNCDITIPCGYVFFPAKAYAAYNLGKYHGSNTHILAEYCNQQPLCVAFNSDGWLKRGIPQLACWEDHGSTCDGTYVNENKVSDVDSS
jgi:hypothetical protein